VDLYGCRFGKSTVRYIVYTYNVNLPKTLPTECYLLVA